MDSEQRLEALVAPLRAEVVSGASVVAGLAAEVFRRAAIRVPVGSSEELRWTMAEVATRVLEAQPAMASLVTLVGDVMDAVEDCESVEAGRHSAARAAETFRGGLELRSSQVAQRASAMIPEGGLVATISSSVTVRKALLAGGSARGHRVVCLESRPMEEGRLLAKALAEARIPVVFAVDAAAHVLASSCDVVFLGADSIGDAGVVNKVGSTALAHAARSADVPLYVLADQTKLLPPGFPQPLDDDRPATEVWAAPAGVDVWNRYFESVPVALVTGVITESEILAPADLERFRSALPLPPGLKTWALGRTSGPGRLASGHSPHA